jgi:hypothetical protein
LDVLKDKWTLVIEHTRNIFYFLFGVLTYLFPWFPSGILCAGPAIFSRKLDFELATFEIEIKEK